MPILRSSVRRFVMAAAVAFAMAAIPTATLFTMPIANATTSCPAGETEDLYTDACIPEMSPNVAGGNWPTTQATGVLPNGTGTNSLPEVAGVPCTGGNSGQCIGLEESQGAPQVTPHSTLSSSP